MAEPRKRKRDFIFNLFQRNKQASEQESQVPPAEPEPMIEMVSEEQAPSPEPEPMVDMVAEEPATSPEPEPVAELVAAGPAPPPVPEPVVELVAAKVAPPPTPLPPLPPPSPPPAAAAPVRTELSDSAEKEMTVQRPVADVFDVVTDFENYPRWVTGLKKVTVLERFEGSGRGKVVEFSAGTLGLSISYTLSYTVDEPSTVSWVSIAGGVKSIVGEYRLTPTPDGTLVRYKLDVDAGFGVPGPVRKAVTNLVIGAALPDLKKYLEKKYKAS